MASWVRFPSPAPIEVDPAFLALMKAEPERLHNPWPQLLDPENPRIAYAQPLVRACYVPIATPSTFIDSLACGEAPIEYWLLQAHELTHARLDFTPAKELMRYYLGKIYIAIAALLSDNRDEWNSHSDELWRTIVILNDHICEMARRLLLSDELIATAGGFLAAERAFPELRKSLQETEATWVEAQQQLIRWGFDESYPEIKRMLAFTTTEETSAVVFQQLGIFLQDIDIFFNDPPYPVSGSEMRVWKICRNAKELHSADDLLDHLDGENRSARGPIESWQYALELATSARGYRYLDSLWTLARGGRQSVQTGDALEASKETQEFYLGTDERQVREVWHLLLHPRERYGQWYLLADTREREADHAEVVGMDSIRQQLAARQGIRCPYFSPDNDICQCDGSSWKEGLQRLVRWAKEGRFRQSITKDEPDPFRKDRKVKRTYLETWQTSEDLIDLPYPCGATLL